MKDLMTVVLIVALCLSGGAAWAGGWSYTGELEDGVTLKLKHKVDTWGECTAQGVRHNNGDRAADAVQKMMDAGGFRFHKQVHRTRGDWIVGVVQVPDARLRNGGDPFVLDQLTFVYHVDDMSDRVLLSQEILLTESAAEFEVFETPVELPSDLYARGSSSGGYIIAVRFEEGSLPPARPILFVFGGAWGYRKPDMVAPRTKGEADEAVVEVAP